MAEKSYGQYTQGLYSWLQSAEAGMYAEEESFTKLMAYISQDLFLRPFSERLLAFYREYSGHNANRETVSTLILDAAGKKGIPFSRSTLNNWLSGNTEPKLGDNDRDAMFRLAFVMGLDATGTEKLFHKVLLDRAFNLRNKREFVYCYCLSNGRSWTAAQELIRVAEAGEEADGPKEEQGTRYLNELVVHTVSDAELVRFIRNNPANFSGSSRTAMAELEKLKSEIMGDRERNIRGLAEQEAETLFSVGRSEIGKGKNKYSVDYMLMMIYDQEPVKRDVKFHDTVRQRLPRTEMYIQFPEKGNLTKSNPSSYMLRKQLILLFFYKFWVKAAIHKMILTLQDFETECNDLLYNRCGFSPLYPGNPYDWLFLYCSWQANDGGRPLDTFRAILKTDELAD